MKQRSFYFLLLIAVLILLTDCSRNVTFYKQAYKQYNQGYYEQAFYTAAQSIQLKSTYIKAQDLIGDTYQKAVTARENNITRLETSVEGNRYDRIVENYQALDRLQERAQQLPYLTNPKTGGNVSFLIKNYSQKWNYARNQAAEYHYRNGLQLAGSGTDDVTQKQAAKEFKQSLTFVENYRDALTRYKQSRSLAIKKLVILPFEDNTGSHHRFGALSDILVDGITSRLLNDSEAMEFMEIVTRAQLHDLMDQMHLAEDGLLDETQAREITTKLGAHELLNGKINQISFSPERINREVQTATATVKTGEEQYTDSFGEQQHRDVTGEVHCDYFVYTKTCNVTLTGSYRITNLETGQIRRQDTFSCENPWQESWGRKGPGDPRAFSDATLRLINKTEPIPPTDTELVSGALNDLTDLITTQIKEYVE